MNKVTFHNAISKLLGVKLGKFTQTKQTELTLPVCLEIYTMIFDTVVSVFEPTNVKLTNEAMNYIAQQYYDAIEINGKHELNPNIFTQRAKVDLIETKELALLAMMMKGTDFQLPIMHEIKRRS